MSKDNSNMVMDLKSMLDYQEESIVSRVILKEKKGNITLFAFDKGQELSEHTAPLDAVVQVLDGKVQVSIDGKPNNLSAGQMIIMPANIPHAIYAEEKFQMILTMIKDE